MSFRNISLWALVLSALLFAFPAMANEQKKIDALLEVIKTSDVTFIRNGSEYTGAEAYDHLKGKMKSALNSGKAPRQEEWTAEFFIENIASRSYISKKPYLVRLKNGEEMETGAWLRDKLKGIEETE